MTSHDTDRRDRIAQRDRAAGVRRQVQAGLTVASLGLTGAVAGVLEGGTTAEAAPPPVAAAQPAAEPVPATPAPRRTVYVVVRQAPAAALPARAGAAPVVRSSGARRGSTGSSGPGPGTRQVPPPRPAAEPPVTSSSGS